MIPNINRKKYKYCNNDYIILSPYNFNSDCNKDKLANIQI